MKKTFSLALALCLLLLAACSATQPSMSPVSEATENELLVIASIYPVYITARNITKDVPGVRVVQLVPTSAGCSHDYQLTPGDIKNVENASVCFINGLDMEPYIVVLRDAYTDLPVFSLDKGFDAIEDTEHGGYNPHVWMDPANVIRQAMLMAEYMGAVDEANKGQYEQNLTEYSKKLTALDEELQNALAPLASTSYISYHDAFAYFATKYGLVIAGTVAHSEDEEPQSAHIAELIDLIKEKSISYILIEDEAERNAAKALSQESGIMPLLLSTVTSGDQSDLDAYIKAMRENARILLEGQN